MMAACSASSEKSSSQEGLSTVLQEVTNEVSVMPLKKQLFQNEVVSNGKVSAAAYSDLYFASNERIARIYVQNGDRVCRGQKLAELDRFTLQNDLTQALNAETEVSWTPIGRPLSSFPHGTLMPGSPARFTEIV